MGALEDVDVDAEVAWSGPVPLSNSTGASNAARRAARRKVASMADPTSRMQTKLVMARPVSHPSEVVASKIR